MTQEEKDLLLRDLCARLPYGVMIQHPDYDEPEVLDTILTPDAYEGGGIQCSCDDSRFEEIHSLKDCKPYLRPMSSMTEEEKKELKFMCDIGPETLTDSSWINGEFGLSVMYKNKASICVDAIDWLNKNMFDFRGLIPKGLALSTEVFNPYTD